MIHDKEIKKTRNLLLIKTKWTKMKNIAEPDLQVSLKVEWYMYIAMHCTYCEFHVCFVSTVEIQLGQISWSQILTAIKTLLAS